MSRLDPRRKLARHWLCRLIFALRACDLSSLPLKSPPRKQICLANSLPAGELPEIPPFGIGLPEAPASPVVLSTQVVPVAAVSPAAAAAPTAAVAVAPAADPSWLALWRPRLRLRTLHGVLLECAGASSQEHVASDE